MERPLDVRPLRPPGPLRGDIHLPSGVMMYGGKMTMTTWMPQRVDVRVPREQAGTLRPGPLSITDGRPTARAVTVRITVRRMPTMTLPADEQTARRLERISRRRARFLRYVLPTYITLIVGIAALAAVVILSDDRRLWFPTQSMPLVLAAASSFLSLFNLINVPAQYPFMQGQYVMVRDVDPVAAAAWAAANPDAGMELVLRG